MSSTTVTRLLVHALNSWRRTCRVNVNVHVPEYSGVRMCVAAKFASSNLEWPPNQKAHPHFCWNSGCGPSLLQDARFRPEKLTFEVFL